MILKTMLLDVIHRRWTRLVDDPSGFPYKPNPDKCWIWVGSFRQGASDRKANQPQASFLGSLINPRNLIYALHNNMLDTSIPILKPRCEVPGCVNPLHQREAGLAPMRDAVIHFDVNQVDWADLFTSINLPRDLTPEEIATQTGAPIDAAKAWSCK